MIFLIEYNRTAGRIVHLDAFENVDSSIAAERRLTQELSLRNQGIEHEVVLLDAADEPALRRTHPRYFQGIAELASRLSATLQSR